MRKQKTLVSVTLGRGQSKMNGIVGIFMIGFGVMWTIVAAHMDLFFALFGILWTGIAVVQTVYQFKNAKAENRCSTYDIMKDIETDDEIEEMGAVFDERDKNFCPYCGKRLKKDFIYCAYCGRKMN